MLMPVFYTTTNTRKRKKVKYTSSEQKRKAMILKQEWEDLVKRHSVPTQKTKTKFVAYTPQPAYHRETPHYPSRDTGHGSATKPINSEKVYTGTKMIGIGTLHKSNAVPVFSEDEASEMARMRRG